MSVLLTKRIIKLLCGRFAYEKGEAYYRERKVTLREEHPAQPLYEATVQGSRLYQIKVGMDEIGDVEAACNCPSYSSFKVPCKHIAAVLLYIHDLQHGEEVPERERTSGSLLYPDGRSGDEDQAESDLTSKVLELFLDKRMRSRTSRVIAESRQLLYTEFVCKVFSAGQRGHVFALELKIGPRKGYVVSKLKEFLEHWERGENYSFSKHYTYDPAAHCFSSQDEAVLQQLARIYMNEQVYRHAATMPIPGYMSSAAADRRLLIPPYGWELLLPLLQKADAVRFEHEGSIYDGLQVSNEPLPLFFDLDEARTGVGGGDGEGTGGYRLEVRGLEHMTVLESYGFVVTQGKLLRVDAVQGKRLAELQQLLSGSSQGRIHMAPGQVEACMERVIPGLMKLGSVRIAEAVSDRLLRRPLQAKLYLDRVRDRLLAGLEFHYGDILINPLEASGTRSGEGPILLRDGERERRILELMEEASFAQTESAFFLDSEESEYHFLYHVMPELEKLADIYATTAVKARLFSGFGPPKVRVKVEVRTDWMEFQFDIAGIPEAEFRQVLASLEVKRKYHRLANGALLPLESEDFQEIVRLMNETGMGSKDLIEKELRVSLAQGLQLMAGERPSSTFQLSASLRQLMEHMRHPEQLDTAVPLSLEPVLRDYQKHGYRWLRMLAHYRMGGVLADDMGLGKTIQSIAFLVSVLPELREQGLPALVVAPASLLYNWHNELKRFAPELRCRIVDGTLDERSGVLGALSEADVLITSYPLLRRDIARYKGLWFHTLILDEAQAFKNHATQTAHAVKQLRARHRFALTGTPMENSLEELWSIYDIVLPGLFPGKKAYLELSRETVARRIRPFLLRRLKTDVLKELPEKIETLQASELLLEQKKLYVAYLAQLQQEALKHLNQDDFHKHRIRILAGLTRLRQICCHPSLFVEGYGGSSAKFEQLLDIIEECRSSGKRMLIFSQFTEMLGIIRRELGQQGIPLFYLDGQTPPVERVELCSRFNQGERDVFLISLKAGGTGLNLTGADTVILYDLWWNPAVEQQAADRAHRMGQQKVVQVIRLVAQGTVEDKMYALQERKRSLIDEVIQPGQEGLSALSEQDIRELLMI
jgi:superfamily II DNA or RNA helicase